MRLKSQSRYMPKHRHNQFGLTFMRQLFHFVVNQPVSSFMICYGFIINSDKFTGEPYERWPPWARSSPINVSPASYMQKYSSISLRTTMWLHVGKLCSKQFTCGQLQLFCLINYLTATIISLPISLGIFVS